MAITAAIAPLLSFAPRSDRYMTSGQRRSPTGVADKDGPRTVICPPAVSVARCLAAAAARLASAAVTGLAALAGNFTLLCRVHGSEPALGCSTLGHASLPYKLWQ